MEEYYLEFKTWAEGDMVIPWPTVWFEETNDYRRRDQPRVRAEERTLRSIFLSFDDRAIRNFLIDHVPALVLGALISGPSADAVLSELEKVFGYCEIFGITKIDDQNRPMIYDIFKVG